MGIAIVSSSKDKAGMNIKESLINNFGFNKIEEKFGNNDIFQCAIKGKAIKLYTIGYELIHAENIDKDISADLFIFISKHVSQENHASLTCHPIGNFGKAEHGGKEKALCIAPAVYLKNILNELSKNAKGSDFDVTMESTHHGPFLEKPVLFVEIGSTEKEWVDKNAGNIIAKSVIGAINKYDGDNKSALFSNQSSQDNSLNNRLNINENKSYESVFIIGGSHYNHVANRAMLESNLAVGHICTKYNLENIDETLIKSAMEKIIPKPKFVLLDWKGLGKEKGRIIEILERNNIKYKRGDKVF